MGGNSKTYSLALIGLREPERRVIKSLCSLSGGHANTYTVTAVSRAKLPSIVLLDGEDQNAMTEWQQLKEWLTRQTRQPIPVVFVSSQKPRHELYRHARRPLVAPHLLRLLDKVVAEELSSEGDSGNALSDEVPGTRREAARLFGAPKAPTQNRAMAVTDDASLREQIEAELRRYAVNVEFVETGEHALWLSARECFEVIFVDVDLPGIDDLCQSIRRECSRKQTRVIVLSGEGLPLERMRGALVGCDDYLPKPVQREDFDEVVQRHLSDGPALWAQESHAY